MPDDWEVAHGLDSTRDDSAEDFDGDGLSNLSESFYGLDPAVKDTDGDNVFDGDELLGANNGFLTDPLDPDSDADLVNDGADAQPLDASITASSPPAAMGTLQLSTNTVVLTSSNLFETVNVTNIGPGSITWGTTVDNDAVALVTPRNPQMITDDGAIGISVPNYFDFNQAFRTRTTVHVVDVAYPNNAPQQISVVIVGDNAPVASTTTTTTTMPALECGNASGDGMVTATDAFAALRTAVGAASCPACLCDVNSNGTTTATDALALLRFGVGQAVELVCVPCPF